jgi:outer membrane protein TolC
LATNRYNGGAVGYLDVVAAHSTALTNQRVAIEISPRRLDASVLLLKAPGGVWDSPERGRVVNRGRLPES